MMRIAISGTYGAGKSTLAKRLAEQSGLPLVAARGMRQFLQEHFNGKPLDACSFEDLIELGVRRFRERLLTEAAHPDGFISDGSTLNEWAYGLGRIRYGFSLRGDDVPEPGAAQQSFSAVMDRLGSVFQDHAASGYDAFVHLPPELELVTDGHRPLMDEYRSYTDRQLHGAYRSIGVPWIVCQGDVDTRARQVAGELGLC